MNILFLLLSFFAFPQLILGAQQPAKTKKPDNALAIAMPNQTKTSQLISLTEEDLLEASLDTLLDPINFDIDGLHRFFRHVLNREEYMTEVLPYSFSHLLQMIDFGIKTKQGSEYFKAVFKIFTIKVKGVRFVSCNEVERLLVVLPDMIQSLLAPDAKGYAQLAEDIKQLLLEELKTKSINNTEQFLTSVSRNITRHLVTTSAQSPAVQTEQMRHAIFVFLDNAFNKMMWSAQDSQSIWPNLERIAMLTAELPSKGIFELSDADTLLWSAIQRFSYFLSITGSDLPLPFYESVRSGLAKTIPGIDTIAEQEQMLLSKRHVLQQAIMNAHIRAEGVAKLHLSA